jgi:fatty acid desaturase
MSKSSISTPSDFDAGHLRGFCLLDRRHAVRLSLFVLFYGIAGVVLCWIAAAHPERSLVWNLAVTPLYLLAAASLHGISLFTHEAVHGTLCSNPRWNAFLGAVCALPVLQNFSAYRILHLRHHEHLGQEGDPDHYPNYTRWTWMVFLMNWGRLLIGYPVYLVAIPILGFKQGRARERTGILLEAAAAALLIFGLLRLPWFVLLHAWLIPMLIINTFVNIRGMSQHTLLEQFEGDTVRGTRTILTDPIVTFFMCNENYHLEHHLHPGVPWYRLPGIHRKLRAELTARGAPYIPSYFAFVREFVICSFRRSPLGSRGDGSD